MIILTFPRVTGAVATSSVLINEIHYSPDVKTEPVEFVELYNLSASSIDLSNWSITGGIDFHFPAGVSIAPDAYVVVAQNPPALKVKFGITGIGPWSGRLSDTGDKISLRDAGGEIMDQVEYKLGFPWPTVGSPPGYSIELIHPELDNSLGGSWRTSVPGDVTSAARTLITAGSVWKYRKGTSEASLPTTAWRDVGFNDAVWESGPAPIGYDPSVQMGTAFADMRNGYTSIFLRKTFVVADTAEISSLTLEAVYDDGFKAWINGVNILNRAMAAGEVAFDATATTTREDASEEVNILPSPKAYLRPGVNVLAIQLHNVSLGGSSDCFIDVRLRADIGSARRGPTPGARNSVFATNAPPQIRQVEHQPEQPGSGEVVRIMAKVTGPDNVKTVTLAYQVVEPGNYVELTDAAYESSWRLLPMNDSGGGGDSLAGDGTYTAVLPPGVQVHRRLIRYRISATGSGGGSITVPYANDPAPNFAYFVYDGVPAWQGAMQPESTDSARRTVVTYGTNIMRRFPVYHLISKKTSVERSTWIEKYGGDLYKWKGTLIYEGKVYDHIGYRARGGVWRYAMGKNMWKFDFNRGHDFKPRDNYGRRYRADWTKLNLGSCIQQGDYRHRGEQGMFESVGFALFNLAGVESPKTHFVQFRVIDDAEEANPTNQYRGDFWGLYLAVEQENGRFLDEHELPDGNLYKMEGGTGSLNNQGPTAGSNRSDLDQFIQTYTSASPPTDTWWRTNLDLQRYYNYRTIVEAIHHYDIDEGAGKNYFYYLNPDTQHWSVHSWDLDLTWADSMYGGGNEPFRARVLSSTRPAFRIDYANRIRELRDLLFNEDQTYRLIDEYAAVLRDPSGGPSFLDADRAQWDFNPLMTNASIVNLSKAGMGRFYQAATTKNFNGMVAQMKSYVGFRATNILDKLAFDSAAPMQPTVTFDGTITFPVNRLRFRIAAYSGANAFASMRWRLAEITPATALAFDPAKPRKYEIEADWESGELSAFTPDIEVPSVVVKVGHTYRVRAQFKDVISRTSRWSIPLEFVAGEPDTTVNLAAGLKVSEFMYQSGGSGEFEFVELRNVSDQVLDVGGVTFTQGIDFTFASGTKLAPHSFIVIAPGTTADNFAAFRAHYGLGSEVSIVGPFGGRLDDNGETVVMKSAAAGTELFAMKYRNGDDSWPAISDAANQSLHLLPTSSSGNNPTSWIAGRPSPGREDPLDRDEDGMPDAWELVNGLNPENPSDAMTDMDGDGISNLTEFLSGTNPRDAQSRLQIEVARVGAAQIELAFDAMQGRSYRVEFTDVIGGEWTSIQKIDSADTLHRIRVVQEVPSNLQARFYRIRTP